MAYLYRVSAIALCSLFLLVSCSKDKKAAKQIAGTWQVQEIETGSNTETKNLPELAFTECNVKKENCPGTWTASDGTETTFQWATDDKGETFILSADSSSTSSQAGYESVYYSGEYAIQELTDSRFVINSSTCTGCQSQSVTIRLTK